MAMSLRLRTFSAPLHLRQGNRSSSGIISPFRRAPLSSTSTGNGFNSFAPRTFVSFLVHRPSGAPASVPVLSRYVAHPPWNLRPFLRREFRTEADFHDRADTTLEDIQDAVEILFEDNLDLGDDDDAEMPEVNVASGVLTLSMPPHGTWVINKQTPNRQIWWSSPLSGPRRYEYDDDRDAWVYTRYVDAVAAGWEVDDDDDEFRDSVTLGAALAAEIKQLYDLDIELDL